MMRRRLATTYGDPITGHDVEWWPDVRISLMLYGSRESQLAIEVLHTPVAKARHSHLAVEVLAPVVPATINIVQVIVIE